MTRSSLHHVIVSAATGKYRTAKKLHDFTLLVRADDAHHRTGLKAWWSRMSNRFRNLKLGGTFKMQNNRLAPLPAGSQADVDASDAQVSVTAVGPTTGLVDSTFCRFQSLRFADVCPYHRRLSAVTRRILLLRGA